MVVNLSLTLCCSSCDKGYEIAVAAEPSFKQDCRDMVKFIRGNANPTSRELALFYIYLLWHLHSGFQQAVISSDFAVQLALLDASSVLATDAYSSQFGWLAIELQRLIADASLRPGMLERDYRLRDRMDDLINQTYLEHPDSYFSSLLRQPVPDHWPVEYLAALFDGLAITAAPDQHNPLMSGLIRFTISRDLPWQINPAALISLLEARLHQRPQDCLGHIEFQPMPDGSMYWPLPYDHFGSSQSLLIDYSLLCSDADVGPLNMIGLMTKILPESLERRLIEWIRSILPDLQADISPDRDLGPSLWPTLPHGSPWPDSELKSHLKDVLYHYEQALVLAGITRTGRLSADESNDQPMQEKEDWSE